MAAELLRNRILRIARAAAAKGVGFAQMSEVMRNVQQELNPRTIEEEQRILAAWNDLFRHGDLEWGFDLENPGSPFFHVPAG
jgi:hypothetical protein